MTTTDASDRSDVDSSIHWTVGRSVADSSPVTLGAAVVVCSAIVAMVATAGLPWPSAITLAALVPAVLVDVIDRRLPDRLVGGAGSVGASSAVVAVAIGHDPHLVGTVLGATALAGPLLLAHLVSPASMGFGDVKFAVVLGAAVGFADPASALLALTLGCALATVHAVVTRSRTIAFGPALLLGAVIALALRSTDALVDMAAAVHSTRTH